MPRNSRQSSGSRARIPQPMQLSNSRADVARQWAAAGVGFGASVGGGEEGGEVLEDRPVQNGGLRTGDPVRLSLENSLGFHCARTLDPPNADSINRSDGIETSRFFRCDLPSLIRARAEGTPPNQQPSTHYTTLVPTIGSRHPRRRTTRPLLMTPAPRPLFLLMKIKVGAGRRLQRMRFTRYRSHDTEAQSRKR